MACFPDIHTDRLVLRRFHRDDIDTFIAYRNDPEVNRYDGLHAIDRHQARDFIARQAVTPAGEPGVWLQIAVALREGGLIGDCGFCVSEDTPLAAEIGYRLHRDWWGKGYAVEAVTGVLGWAFGPLALHRVIALIDTRNTPSIRLVERLGFRREGTFVESYPEPDGWSDEYLYALLDREWRTRNG